MENKIYNFVVGGDMEERENKNHQLHVSFGNLRFIKLLLSNSYLTSVPV